MRFSIAFHVVGIVFWLGSLIVLTRLLTLGCDPNSKPSEPLRNMASRLFWGFSVGGLAVATLSGLYQILSMGVGFYMKQGWFHGKLTLILVLYCLTAATFIQLKKFSAGEVISRKTAAMLHGTTSLILVIAVFLTILGR